MSGEEVFLLPFDAIKRKYRLKLLLQKYNNRDLASPWLKCLASVKLNGQPLRIIDGGKVEQRKLKADIELDMYDLGIG